MAKYQVVFEIDAPNDREAWKLAQDMVLLPADGPGTVCVLPAGTGERSGMVWSVTVPATHADVPQCDLMLAYDGREERAVVAAYVATPSASWGEIGVRSFYIAPEQVAIMLRAMRHWPLDQIDKAAQRIAVERARGRR